MLGACSRSLKRACVETAKWKAQLKGVSRENNAGCLPFAVLPEGED
jgi:hypothetical protein